VLVEITPLTGGVIKRRRDGNIRPETADCLALPLSYRHW
jgi:hypothetical protein